jgi:hypothetical protein
MKLGRKPEHCLPQEAIMVNPSKKKVMKALSFYVLDLHCQEKTEVTQRSLFLAPITDNAENFDDRQLRAPAQGDDDSERGITGRSQNHPRLLRRIYLLCGAKIM